MTRDRRPRTRKRPRARGAVRRPVPGQYMAVIAVLPLPYLVDTRRGPRVRWFGEDNR